MKSQNRLLFIFILAFSLRLCLFIAVGSWHEDIVQERIIIGDAEGYHHLAVNLLEQGIFSLAENPPYIPDTFRTPIYPYFLSLVYTIFGYKPYIAILIQTAIGAMICILTYKIGCILFNENVALFSGLFTAIEYSSIALSNMLLTDILFAFLFIIHIFYAIKFLKLGSTRTLACSSIFLGLSTLCRPISVYFFIFLALVFLIHFRNNLRRGILNYSILTLIFFLTVLPWVMRNYEVSNAFVVSSLQMRVVQWNFPRFFNKSHLEQSNRINNDLYLPESRKEGHTTPNKKNNLFNLLSYHTHRYLVVGTTRFFFMPGSSIYPFLLGLSTNKMHWKIWNRVSEDMTVIKTVIQRKSRLELILLFVILTFLIYLYSMMCVGIYASIRKGQFVEVLILLSVILYFALASASASGTRYRMPVMPYIILLSCYGMMQFPKKLPRFFHPRTSNGSYRNAS